MKLLFFTAVVIGSLIGRGRASSNVLSLGDSGMSRLPFDDQKLTFSAKNVPDWVTVLPTSFMLDFTIVEAGDTRLGGQPYVW